MTRGALTATLLAFAAIPLSACAGGYASVNYGGGPYAYDGYYDGYYGQVYDGYWGDDDYFYYRRNGNDRGYVRGDRNHFARSAPEGRQNYQPLRGNMTPGQGMRMPHFPRGQNGGNNGGHGNGHDHHN